MLLTISEAARLLGICENTLRDWDDNGKFRAIRTEGRHRRYSLEQIRKYLNENQKVERQHDEYCVDYKLVDKWQFMLGDVPNNDRFILATLLENASCFDISTVRITQPEYLWLTKESWLRSKFRKMVTVQPLTEPCGLVFYNNGNNMESDAVAVKSIAYGFKMFNNAEFEQVKNLYADTIALEIDNMIFQMLPKINIETLQDAIAAKAMSLHYDYIIGPESLIKNLGGVDSTLYTIPAVLDEKSFSLAVAAGWYPTAMSLPIFCPYILVMMGPLLVTGVRSCMMRVGNKLKI